MDRSPGSGNKMLENLDRLEENLLIVRLQYEATSAARQLETDRNWIDRGAAYHGLLAVLQFLDSDPEWRALQLGFGVRRLVIALNHVEQGATEPLFAPTRTGTRPRQTDDRLDIEGRCSGAISYLIEQRRTEQTACEHVLRALGNERIRWLQGAHYRDKEPNWRTVARWRSTATGGLPEAVDRVAHDYVLDVIKRASVGSDKPAEYFADAIIRALCGTIAEIGGPPAFRGKSEKAPDELG